MRRIQTALFVYSLACGCMYAQNTSQVSGTVRDSSGLAVPGAQITITQTDTGLSRNTQSEATGVYLLPNLPIGPYRLEVKKDGFMTAVQSNIILQVDTNPAIDIDLKVGSVNEQVVVEAAAAMVETQSTGVGQVINQEQVVDLPLNGRQASQLIFLAGASTTGPNGQINTAKNYPNEQIIQLAGGTSAGITYLLDGGTHNDPFNGLGFPFPFPDALQEFKVETSALPAQYGYHAAGAVNAVTKSGTNNWHGDAFEFVRNTDFNAKDYFASVGDGLKRNQFGGTIGGPIKKNKLFFFAGYQNTTIRSTPANTVTFLPTLAMIEGNFQTYAAPTSAGGCQTTGQKVLKDGFVNNILPASLLNPSAVEAMTFYPPAPDQNCGRETYATLANSSEYMGVAKVDYRFNDKHTIFGRYLGMHSLGQPSSVGGSLESTILAPGTDDLVQSAVFGDTYIFGPNTINSFRGTFTREAICKNQVPMFGTTGDAAKALGINIYDPLPNYLYFNVTGAFQSSGVSGTCAYITTHQISNDLSLIRGSHQIQFGANYIRPAQNGNYTTWVNGEFTFNGSVSGLADADFMLGALSSYTQMRLQEDVERHQYVGPYVQDSWKIKSNLTLNYGIRWEPYFGPSMKDGYVSHFDYTDFLANVHSSVYPNAPAGTFFPGDSKFTTGKRPNNVSWKDFAPRIGMVWDPLKDGRTTIRASYGIFYDLPFTIENYDYATEPPFGEGVTLTQPGGGFSNPWLGQPGGNPFPVALNKNVPFPQNGTYLTDPLNLKPTYLEQWNLTIQKQLGRNWLLSASYLGNDTIHLWSSVELDPALYVPGNCVAGQYGLTAPGPCSSTGNVAARRIFTLANPAQGGYYGAVYQVDDGGTAGYNALYLNVNHRLASHFTLLGNYTWSHCIADPYSQYLGGSYTDPANRRLDRGNCPGGEDVRQNVNMSVVADSPRYSQKLVQAIAGNWRLSGILQLHSGAPATITTGVSENLSGIGGDRPNQVLANPYCAVKSASCWINGAAFVNPAVGTYGSTGVYTVLGPAYFDIDLGLSRTFVIREKNKIEIRAEAFNIQNRVNFNAPGAALNSATFGQITSDASPRIMQFAVRYVY